MFYHLKDKNGKMRIGACYSTDGKVRANAYCPSIQEHFKENGKLFKTDPKPSDIVLFCWDKSGIADHIGIVEKYNKETGALTDQFNQEMPAIGRGWASRGAYDSSYRVQGEQNATDAYGRQIEGLGTAKIADEGKIGTWAAQQRATLENDRGGVNAIGALIDSEQDINSLTELKNKIDQRLRDNTAKRADYTTQGAARQSLMSSVPLTDNSGALGKVLGQIIQGEAPKALKIATAQQIIGSSGLTEEEKARLTQTVATQIQG